MSINKLIGIGTHKSSGMLTESVADAFASGVLRDEEITYTEACFDVAEAVSDVTYKASIAKKKHSIAETARKTLMALDMQTASPDERFDAALEAMETTSAAYNADVDASAASFTLDSANIVLELQFPRKRRRLF